MVTSLTRLNLLKHFFNRIDNGSLFDGVDPEVYRVLRREVGEALYNLLLQDRPFLEKETGLAWPYQGLKERVSVLENIALQGKTLFIRQQAQLFLALLPFPDQWRWLIRAEKDMGDASEIKELLISEKKRIAAKIHKKSQEFKLRHFCQILKRPNLPDEKGILRIFSLPYLFADRRLLQRLNRLYVLYVEPPWGVLARHAWLRAFAQMADPIMFGVGGGEDAAFLGTQAGVVITRLAHGDFLEEETVPLGQKKQYDIVFNASFDDMDRKRHSFMLDLLARPPLDHITALFIGRGSPSQVETFAGEVRQRGLEHRVAVLANILRKEVPQQLARCRIGVQASVHENACRSIYECFRSDLPCVVTSSMAGFNFDLITPQTGRVVSDLDVSEAILDAVHHPERFSPRQWFLANSGGRNSSLRLNQEFKVLFAGLGYSWTEDIVPLGGSGATRYVDEAHYDAFHDEFEQLLEILGPLLPVRLSLE
ncbi:MAG: hypothetical protein VR65_00200 [Desulfobulbaceae bacterium BRH_c16a]|nr:MAG: hypothetical protein VR65_00200 [Desulfobulbaceae bacterium BRH_c16a]